MSDSPQPVAATTEVTVWSLEQTSPDDLRPAAVPDGDVRIVRSEVVLPEFSRFLYTAVGGDIRWTDRLGMTYARWQEALRRPGAETWVAYENGTPAGYVELDPQDDGVVEIMYFGLIPGAAHRRSPPVIRGGARLGPGRALARAAGDEAGLAAHLLEGRPARDGQLPAARLPALRHEDRGGAGGGDARSVARGVRLVTL
jgi:hypothetical protein